MVNTKRILITSMMVGICSFPVLAHAEDGMKGPNLRKNVRTEVKTEIKKEIKDIKTTAGGAARLINAQLTAVSDSVLTVTLNGKTYKVDVSNSREMRRFWGTSATNEFSVGDKLNIWGTWTDEAKTTVKAQLVRDLSIQKVHSVFLGDISSKTNGSFVVTSKERGTLTVTVSSSTKYISRNETSMSYADLKVGDRVRVDGVWNKANNTVTEVKTVKDFTVPVKNQKKAPSTSSTNK